MDTRRPPLRLPGLSGRRERVHPARDWREFEPLIGHAGSDALRGPFARIRRLKPAQIADLLEDASRAEEAEILGRVHGDPELEADVFEELDEDLATRLLGTRTDAEIAAVMARMGADDAADAIADLPQGRRQAVLDLLPPGQRVKVTTLLGFSPSSAGGLMGLDYLALPGTLTVGEALTAVGRSGGTPPGALANIHAVDACGRLLGVVPLVTLLQADPAAGLAEVCDTDPVRIAPDTDVTDVAVLMADFNLVTIPVVDTAGIALRISPKRRSGSAAPRPRIPREQRNQWRMPPLAMLKPVTWSPALKLAMLALRGYLVIAALLLLIKAIQLGTG